VCPGQISHLRPSEPRWRKRRKKSRYRPCNRGFSRNRLIVKHQRTDSEGTTSNADLQGSTPTSSSHAVPTWGTAGTSPLQKDLPLATPCWARSRINPATQGGTACCSRYVPHKPQLREVIGPKYRLLKLRGSCSPVPANSQLGLRAVTTWGFRSFVKIQGETSACTRVIRWRGWGSTSGTHSCHTQRQPSTPAALLFSWEWISSPKQTQKSRRQAGHWSVSRHSYICLTGREMSAHHFQGTAQHSAQEVGIDEGRVVVRELNKVHQGVIFQDQGELVASRTPVGDARSDAQVHFKCYLLCQTEYEQEGVSWSNRTALIFVKLLRGFENTTPFSQFPPASGS